MFQYRYGTKKKKSIGTPKHEHCIDVFNVSSGVVMVTNGYNLLWKIWDFSVDREPWQGLDYPMKAADSCIINF